MSDVYTVKETYKKSFIGDTPKDAYLKAVKWYATNVVNHDGLPDGLMVSIVRRHKKNFPTFDFIIYSALDDDEQSASYCERCQELSRNFYVTDRPNCNQCKHRGYRKQLDQKLKVKAGSKKVRIKENDERSEAKRESPT